MTSDDDFDNDTAAYYAMDEVLDALNTIGKMVRPGWKKKLGECENMLNELMVCMEIEEAVHLGKMTLSAKDRKMIDKGEAPKYRRGLGE